MIDLPASLHADGWLSSLLDYEGQDRQANCLILKKPTLLRTTVVDYLASATISS